MTAPRRGGITDNAGISLDDMKFCMGDECDKNDIDNMEMRQAPACFFQSLARRNHTTFLPNDLTFETSQESGTHRPYSFNSDCDFRKGRLLNPLKKRETERLVKLYNIDEDPTERDDVSDDFPKVFFFSDYYPILWLYMFPRSLPYI